MFDLPPAQTWQPVNIHKLLSIKNNYNESADTQNSI